MIAQAKSELLDRLPDAVVDGLPSGIVDGLQDGTLDKIPEDVVDALPAGLQDAIPESAIDFASTNPQFTAILIAVGVISVLGFGYGVSKAAMKASMFFAILGAVAWFWLLK